MRNKLIIVIVLLGLGLALAMLWPAAHYDINRVEPSLRQLATPYRSVRTDYFADGGSIGLTIVDRDGRTLKLALPVSPEHGRSYPQLFIGTTHTSEPGAVEVPFSEDTRRMLISIMEDHRVPGGISDIALAEFRGAPRDYFRIIWEGIARRWQSWTQ